MAQVLQTNLSLRYRPIPFTITPHHSPQLRPVFLSRSLFHTTQPSLAPPPKAKSLVPTAKSKRQYNVKDKRIKLIRYHLHHPLNPSPLRFDRERALRHWTIQRAWSLWRKKQHDERQQSLQRQYSKMRDAVEELRNLPDGGRLFRTAMERKGLAAEGYPIEMRTITDTPSRKGWDHEWKRNG